ncbi:MAG: hypothetical protein NT091_00585 [Candidatus Falkowbacteria bacterium]|nr:hypothetical protein [Candidatus Falkowbacteria bacterium]
MDITINLTPILNFLSQSPDVVLNSVFLWFGTPSILLTLLLGFYEVWLNAQQGKWGATNKFILLAIDVPRANVQSPKAVENIFTYLAGAHGTQNLIEKYIEGKFQLCFSFEIVSIDGFTQFLVRTPEVFRYLTETAIYSQYPDAEITEVDDYVQSIPTEFPDDTWDIWGAEFIYAKSSAYPIKTYKNFESQVGPSEMQYKDPMAALMDLCSSLKEGEQLWYQIIIKPIGFDWMINGENEISKILKEEVVATKNIGDVFVDLMISSLQFISEVIYSLWGNVAEKVKEEKKALKMMDLKPSQKLQVEAISEKISKISFDTKIRFLYVAKKEVMDKAKVANGFVGYIKQFADLQLNNLRPDIKKTATSVTYQPKSSRLNKKKRKIMNNYKKRSGSSGTTMQTMSIEELATLWNFPSYDYVKATGLQKVTAKRSQPPASLPVPEMEKSSISDELAHDLGVENETKTKVNKNQSTVNNADLDESLFEDKKKKIRSQTIFPLVNIDN